MRLICTFIVSILLCSSAAFAQVVNFTPWPLTGQAIVNPVDITGAGDGSGRVFVVEKRGTIRIIQNGAVLQDTFLDIRNLVEDGGERGLLGLAFHPNYPDVPHVYVNYVQDATTITTIARYSKDPNNPNKLLKSSGVILFTQLGEQSNHKAGDLCFGPDGYLYITMGDGGGSFGPNDHAQDINHLLGKILRIDVNVSTPPYYTSPPSNPYFGATPGDDRVWLIGLRNPWRISFDRLTGDLWIADVGQNQWEEIHFIPAGSPGGLNLGWDCYEGNHATSESGECPAGTQFTWPVFEYSHSLGASVTGGFVYRGPSSPSLHGIYIFVDYISDNMWKIGPPPTFTPQLTNLGPVIEDMVAFGESDEGELFAVGLNGVVYFVTGEEPLPIQWVGIKAKHITNGNRIEWTIMESSNIDHFEIQRSLTPSFDDYNSAGNVQPKEDVVNYRFDDLFLQSAGVYYRVAAHLMNGSKEYSPIVRILPDPVSKPALIFDAGTNLWRLQIPSDWENGNILIYDLQGKQVYSKKFAADRMIEIGPPVVPGCYFIQINSNNETWSDRFVW